MIRSHAPEIMDNPDVPEELTTIFHRDLLRIHSILGNAQPVVERLRNSSSPVHTVMDIGCGQGALLAHIRHVTGAKVIGVDLKPPHNNPYGVTIVAADATKDELPLADVAVSFLTIHHLTEAETIALIRNVRRSAKRFIIMDLVRHPLPLVLFSLLIGPLMHRCTAADGRLSIRRAYTAPELAALVKQALQGTGGRAEQWVSPIFARQIIDITYAVRT